MFNHNSVSARKASFIVKDDVPVPFDTSEELVQDIFNYKKYKQIEDDNLLDIIVHYAYDNQYNLNEVGEMISEHKHFKKILEENLKKNKYIPLEKNEYNYYFKSDEEW